MTDTAQIPMFIPKCNNCNDSGVSYMFHRSMEYTKGYTIPIHCSCELDRKKWEEEYDRTRNRNNLTSGEEL